MQIAKAICQEQAAQAMHRQEGAQRWLAAELPVQMEPRMQKWPNVLKGSLCCLTMHNSNEWVTSKKKNTISVWVSPASNERGCISKASKDLPLAYLCISNPARCSFRKTRIMVDFGKLCRSFKTSYVPSSRKIQSLVQMDNYRGYKLQDHNQKLQIKMEFLVEEMK